MVTSLRTIVEYRIDVGTGVGVDVTALEHCLDDGERREIQNPQAQRAKVYQKGKELVVLTRPRRVRVRTSFNRQVNGIHTRDRAKETRQGDANEGAVGLQYTDSIGFSRNAEL